MQCSKATNDKLSDIVVSDLFKSCSLPIGANEVNVVLAPSLSLEGKTTNVTASLLTGQLCLKKVQKNIHTGFIAGSFSFNLDAKCCPQVKNNSG